MGFRYARWSLGFVDPPIEISGSKEYCTIKALNKRGSIILPAIINAMNKLHSEGTLSEVNVSESETFGKVDVKIVPPGEVGSFSEEERSRQVSFLIYPSVISHFFIKSCSNILFCLDIINSLLFFQLSVR